MAVNLKKKRIVYFLQLVAGVVCYAFLQVTVKADLLSQSAHIMLFRSNEEYRENAIVRRIVTEDGSVGDSIITMGNAAYMLLQVSFCFWVITFFNLITQFPKFYQADAGGKRSLSKLVGLFNFEYMFHTIAMILYVFLSCFLLTRVSMARAWGPFWNITGASISGLIAGILHGIYSDILKKEYKQHLSERSGT